MRPSASGRTWTISAPRSSCAWAICPTVGNSYSLITIRFRSPERSSAETSPLTPCETDVVTATSSGSACTRRGERSACRLVPLDPELPLRAVLVPAREPLLGGGAHTVRERALRARVGVGRVLEDRELAADLVPDHRPTAPGTPCAAPRARAGRRPCPRARPDPWTARTRGRRSRARRSRSAPR